MSLNFLNDLFLCSSPMHDFGAMALLRQYSLLNLPTSWKASLISSYGSFLAQQQQEFSHQPSSSPFHRSLLTRGSVSGAGTIVPSAPAPPPMPLPPISAVTAAAAAAAAAAVAVTPQPPLPPSLPPSNSAPPPLPLPPSSTSRKSNSSNAASSSSARLSPNSNKQRTYPCNECGKIFNAHYNLTRHMPVHTGKILFLFYDTLMYLIYGFVLCYYRSATFRLQSLWKGISSSLDLMSAQDHSYVGEAS